MAVLPGRVLVIGGSSATGRPVVSALLKEGLAVRVLTRDPEFLARHFPELDIAAGSPLDADTLKLAMADCSAVHIHLNGYYSDQFAHVIEQRAVEVIIQAARESGVSYVTYLSWSTVTDTGSPHIPHQVKAACESLIINSGLGHTILRTSVMMEEWHNFISTNFMWVYPWLPVSLRFVSALDYGRAVAQIYTAITPESKIVTLLGAEGLYLNHAIITWQMARHAGLTVLHLPRWLAYLWFKVTNQIMQLNYLALLEYLVTIPEPLPEDALFSPDTMLTVGQWSVATPL